MAEPTPNPTPTPTPTLTPSGAPVGRLCAVLGDPIEHSLSPVLHRAGYAALGLDDWSYHAVRVPVERLGSFLAALDPADGWRGLSLTMPLKREILELVERTGHAREAWRVAEVVVTTGGANTVVLDADGPVLDNTDRPGAAAALRERHTGPIAEVSVLGAGATGASVGLAMCDLGASRVRLLARDSARGLATKAAIAAHPSRPQVEVLDLVDPDVAVTGEVVVSTVPAHAQSPELMARCAGVPVVFEVVYDPWPTPLAAAAIASGRTLVTGLDLLVHQAGLQFSLFTDRPAPLAAMRTAGEEALAARA